MYTRHFALQHLHVFDGEVITDNGELFDREAYARFKYGYLPPAETYGRGLAEAIGHELLGLAGDAPIRIVSAPYKHLPTASHAVAEVLVRELSDMAIDRGFEPPVLVPFHKSRMGSSNYAKSSEADRQRSLATLGLRIDPSLIEGAHVLIVDDIRITGSAERATADFLEKLGPRGVWYLHAARLSDEVGKAFPGLENELNQSVSHNYDDVLREIATGQFQLNTRVLRHILEFERDAYEAFLQGVSVQFLREMHGAALGSGLDYYRKHQTNIDRLAVVRARREKGYAHAGN